MYKCSKTKQSRREETRKGEGSTRVKVVVLGEGVALCERSLRHDRRMLPIFTAIRGRSPTSTFSETFSLLSRTFDLGHCARARLGRNPTDGRNARKCTRYMKNDHMGCLPFVHSEQHIKGNKCTGASTHLSAFTFPTNMDSTLPIINLDAFLSNPNSDQALEECKKARILRHSYLRMNG
jgi:hypothetical protein